MNSAGGQGAPEPGEPPLPRPDAGADGDPRLAALRARGTDRFDPVRFRFCEALARRAAVHGGEVRLLLDRKLAQALADLDARHDRVRPGGGPAPGFEPAARSGPLAELVRLIDGPAAVPSAAGRGAAPPQPGELRALRDARSTWARLSVDRQLNRSLAKAPANPGPLNSHGLALRALQLMQSLSPAYLERFMAHVDALLWLDEASLGDAPAPHPGARRDGDRKPRPSRTRPGGAN